jgi:hypothetical protein
MQNIIVIRFPQFSFLWRQRQATSQILSFSFIGAITSFRRCLLISGNRLSNFLRILYILDSSLFLQLPLNPIKKRMLRLIVKGRSPSVEYVHIR